MDFETVYQKFKGTYIVSKQYKKHYTEYLETFNAIESVLDSTERELLIKLLDLHITHSEDYAKSAVKYFLSHKTYKKK